MVLGVPFEEILPRALMRLRPEMSQVPEGHRLIQEALNNRALDYEARAGLLHEGETQLSDAQDDLQAWRAGQGAVAGGLFAGAVMQGSNLVGELGRYLDKARHDRAIHELTAASGSLRGVPASTFQMHLTNKTLAQTGMLPGGGGNMLRMFGQPVPPRAMSMQELVRGPLMAREGNIEAAIQDLGRLTKETAEGLGANPRREPQLSRALRIAGRRHSLWDQISSKSARLMQAASNVALKPSVRLGLAAAAVGLGAYTGYTTAGPEISPRTREDAMDFLMQRDSQASRMGAPPIPSDLAAPVTAAQRQVARLYNPKRQADILEMVLGGPMLALDSAASAADPNWGIGWESLG